ncbi:hypothetical protein ACKLNO_10670 [Neisseriaceae bacterium B1]
MKKLTALLLLAALSNAAIADEVQVFNWKTSNGSNAYSDTPHNLQMGRSNVMNVRTGTVTAPPPAAKPLPTNAVEAQQMANEMAAAENKRQQEAAAEQAKQIKEENCKTAQMNRANAENARNKDELIPKFDEAIAKYCTN